MVDVETARKGEEAVESDDEEITCHKSIHSKGGPEEEQLAKLISLTPIHIKDEADLDTESRPDKPPLQTPRSPNSHSCCWSHMGPFYRQTIMTSVVCLSAFSMGTIYAFPGVALARWEDTSYNFTTGQVTWFASTPILVSAVMSVVAGVVVERLGVRLCLTIGSLVLIVTWVMIAQATNFSVLLSARFIQGVVLSLYLVVTGVYPVEVSQVRWRGIMTGVNEAMLMLGAFLTYLGGLVLLPEPLSYTFACALVPQFLLFFFVRESPLWLARRGREDDVVDSLKCLRGSTVDINPELEHIKSSVYTEKIHRPTAAEQLLLLRKPIYLKPLSLCVLILLFKELTGQYAAVAYTVKIFQLAGSSLDPYWCAVVMGAARFLPCFLSWVLIERFNRRLLLSTCLAVVSVSLATLGIFLWVWSDSDKGLGPHLGWVPIVCLLIFTLVNGVGVGPISWTMVAELLPSQVRNVFSGFANSCFCIFQFLVGLTFPFSVEAVGVGGVFIAYSLFSLFGLIFALVCLPETRGRSFNDIQKNFGSSKECPTAL